MGAMPAALSASTIRRVTGRPISSGTRPISNSYLTDPQAVIPGAVMLYKQKNADVRKAIIAFLKEQK